MANEHNVVPSPASFCALSVPPRRATSINVDIDIDLGFDIHMALRVASCSARGASTGLSMARVPLIAGNWKVNQQKIDLLCARSGLLRDEYERFGRGRFYFISEATSTNKYKITLWPHFRHY